MSSPAPDPEPAPLDGPPPVSRRGALVGLGVVGLGVVVTGTLLRGGGEAQDGPLTLPSGSRFEIVTTTGAVSITGGSGAAEGRWSAGPEPQVDTEGDLVRIMAGESELMLYLPVLETLSVSTSSADVTIDRTVVGDVSATTETGDVRMRLEPMPTSVSVTTDSGHVAITLPGQGFRYQIDTDSGATEVPADSGEVPVTVTTGSGDISIDEFQR